MKTLKFYECKSDDIYNGIFIKKILAPEVPKIKEQVMFDEMVYDVINVCTCYDNDTNTDSDIVYEITIKETKFE